MIERPWASDEPRELILCADATPTIGAGHVMRSLVLAHAWRELGVGPVSLYGTVSIGFVAERMSELGVVHRSKLSPCGRGVLVVDSYNRDRREEGARATVTTRVLVDDLGGPVPEGFHVVWNPNEYGSAASYPRFGGEVIAGHGVVPIRTGLPEWMGRGSGKTGVMLGGGTPPMSLVDALVGLALREGETVFVGAGAWVSTDWQAVDATDPWAEFATCEALITAGGSTVWEAAAVGIPVVVVRTAANQDLICGWVADRGAPVVDALGGSDPLILRASLQAALARPRRLPPLASGANRVVERLRGVFAKMVDES